jgi:hypothetical protein
LEKHFIYYLIDLLEVINSSIKEWLICHLLVQLKMK